MPENTPVNAVPTYATAEDALAWRSPAPLERDHVHSDTGQTFRIAGICKAKDRSAIYEEIRRLKPTAKAIGFTVGYTPTDGDITDACWAEQCVTAPKMTALQWLQFGAEASLGEVAVQCLIASRIIEERKPDAIAATTPDGVDAAEEELAQDPT